MKVKQRDIILINFPFSVLQGKVLKIQAKIKLEKLQDVKLLIQELID